MTHLTLPALARGSPPSPPAMTRSERACWGRGWGRTPKAGNAGLLVGRFEFAQQLVAALHRLVERGLGVLLARPYRFELLVDDVADLHEVADAQALGVVGRRIERQLLDRDVAARELLVEAFLLRQLGGGGGDRHVAGLLV